MQHLKYNDIMICIFSREYVQYLFHGEGMNQKRKKMYRLINHLRRTYTLNNGAK